MKLAWIGLIVQLLFLILVKPFISDTESAVICLIGINALILLLGIIRYEKGFRELFYSAYVLRVVAMFWDVYGRSIYTLPHSGTDSEDFLHSAILVANDLSLLKGNIYGDIYTKILGVLFYITDPERVIGHYINVLLGVTTIIIVYKILSLLDINKKTMTTAILLVSFFPHGIIFSSILLRENFVSIFVTASLYYFIKWYKHKRNLNMWISFLCLAAASWFHSGVIGIAIGYVFMYMFYNHNTNRFSFSLKSILVLIIFVIVSIFVFTQLEDVLLGKFDTIDGINDVFNTANTRVGGSSYLTGLKAKSTWQLILFSPIMMFYFLVSPLPMDWRGINDIISFSADGFIYFIFLVYGIANAKKHIGKKPILIGILIMIIIVVFTFGIGVQNAGTALRHRHKIFNLIIVFCAIIHDSKEAEKYETNILKAHEV